MPSDVTTPNPCNLTTEEQEQVRTILKQVNPRNGINRIAGNFYIRNYLSTSNNNKGNRLDIDVNDGLKVYDANGNLLIQIPLSGANLSAILTTLIQGINTGLLFQDATATGKFQITATQFAVSINGPTEFIVNQNLSTLNIPLTITTTVGALTVPRLTTTQKNALTPVNGMILYDSTLNKFQGYENGAWTNLI